MIDRYSNGKIYKLVDNTNGAVYIGSTCLPLHKRLYNHKKSYNLWLNKKYHYVSSFKILENENYNIVLIENYSCNSKEELLMKERKWIDELKCVNIYKPIVNIDERKELKKIYCEKNKEHIQERNKKYEEQNKEKRKEQKNIYYLINKEKIKKYYEDNKEIIQQKKHIYYEASKEISNCPICNKEMLNKCIDTHIKTFHK